MTLGPNKPNESFKLPRQLRADKQIFFSCYQMGGHADKPQLKVP